MKTILLAAGLALALGASANAAPAFPKAQGEVSAAPKIDWGDAKFKIDAGWNIGGAVGDLLAPHWGLEANTIYSRDSFTPSSVDSESLSADADYRWGGVGSVNPYLGVGAVAVNAWFGTGRAPSAKLGHASVGAAGLSAVAHSNLLGDSRFQGLANAAVKGAGVYAYKAASGVHAN